MNHQFAIHAILIVWKRQVFIDSYFTFYFYTNKLKYAAVITEFARRTAQEYHTKKK